MAIEVKFARSVNQRAASSLMFFRNRLGDQFQCGILFGPRPVTARTPRRAGGGRFRSPRPWDRVTGAKDSLEDARS